MAERLDIISSVKLGGFRSQFETFYVSSHTEDVIQRSSLSVDDYISFYICQSKLSLSYEFVV